MHLRNPLQGTDWEVLWSYNTDVGTNSVSYGSYSQDSAKWVAKARRLNPFVDLWLNWVYETAQDPVLSYMGTARLQGEVEKQTS